MKPKQLAIALLFLTGCASQPQPTAAPTPPPPALAEQVNTPSATPASSGNPGNPTPHLAVKPQMPGIETNLTIYTTARIYHLILRSGGHALQEVQFYYPEQIMEE